jgi:hypothetical protein
MVHSCHTNGRPQSAGVDNQERAIACCGAVMRDRYDALLRFLRNWMRWRTDSPQRPGRTANGAAGGGRCDVFDAASISSSLGKGREPGVEAEFCELDDKAFGPDFL